jgi:hypothetical protein
VDFPARLLDETLLRPFQMGSCLREGQLLRHVIHGPFFEGRGQIDARFRHDLRGVDRPHHGDHTRSTGPRFEAESNSSSGNLLLGRHAHGYE